jgi:hypothetical protein
MNMLCYDPVMGSEYTVTIKWYREWTTLLVIGCFILLALIYFYVQQPATVAPSERREKQDKERLIQNPDNVWYN